MVTITKGPKCSVAQMLNGIYYCNLVSAIRFVSFCTWPFLHCSIWVRYILISWHYVLNKNKSMTSICIKNKYLPQIMSTNSLILLHRILINGSKSQAYLIRETVFSSKQAICHFIQFFFQWIFKKLKYKKSCFFVWDCVQPTINCVTAGEIHFLWKRCNFKVKFYEANIWRFYCKHLAVFLNDQNVTELYIYIIRSGVCHSLVLLSICVFFCETCVFFKSCCFH